MGNPVPRDVQQAFRDVCFEFGVEKLAAMMGMSVGTLYNKCNCNENENNHNKPSGRELVLVTLLTGDKRIAQAFSRTVGGIHLDLPDLSNLTTDALMLHLVRIEEEGGDFYRALHGALKSNNDITGNEFADIEARGHEWIAAILESLVRMKEMSGGGK
jgi:hypothetical protein